jgi:hypothetical protein
MGIEDTYNHSSRQRGLGSAEADPVRTSGEKFFLSVLSNRKKKKEIMNHQNAKV